MTLLEKLTGIGLALVGWMLVDAVVAVARRRLRQPALSLELIQYLLVPPAFIVSIALSSEPFELRQPMSNMQWGCFFLVTAYFVYGGAVGLIRRAPMSVLIHHLALGAGAVGFILFCPMMQSMALVGTLQINSTVHESGRAARKMGWLVDRGWARFMTLELVVFVVARFALFTPFAIWVIYDAWMSQPPLWVFAVITSLCLPMMTALHVHWYRATVRRWRRAWGEVRV